MASFNRSDDKPRMQTKKNAIVITDCLFHPPIPKRSHDGTEKHRSSCENPLTIFYRRLNGHPHSGNNSENPTEVSDNAYGLSIALKGIKKSFQYWSVKIVSLMYLLLLFDRA